MGLNHPVKISPVFYGVIYKYSRTTFKKIIIIIIIGNSSTAPPEALRGQTDGGWESGLRGVPPDPPVGSGT